ncbi:ATP-binding protein [Nitrosospira multiformis]|uniref:Nephrocystin 3-like N-terminal domain-containing protein n=1 Tax=Nitrosospira multiformis TaxID=1231 RepID=A0A1I7FTH9_9PROT|nr:ATP-binding protein [Nitrosospira multiformis]SFU39473.1 hypothetical protein SAMN05216417_102203 [Nitrosospira multiformis]
MNSQPLKEKFRPESISSEFGQLFTSAWEFTRRQHTDGVTSSREYVREFYNWIKPKDARNSGTFRALVEKVTGNTYSTFGHWQSEGSPKNGDKASLCFGASAQFHGVHIEEHFARFIHFWNSFREKNSVAPDFSEYKTESKKLRAKYRLIPIEQYPFAAQIQTLLHPESFERHSVFNEIKGFIDSQPSGYFMIEGGAGMGKSWLIAYTATTLHDSGLYNCAWHFNELASGLNGSYDLLKSLFPQFSSKYDLIHLQHEYERVLQNDTGYAAFYQTLFDHLSYCEPLEGHPLVILIDALDEVSSLDSSIEAKSNTQFIPQRLPKNIYIVVTSRNFSRETFIGNTKKIRLTVRSAFQKKDIEGYIRQQARKNNVKNWIEKQYWKKDTDPTEAFVDLMIRSSQLTFIYLFFVFRQIEDYTPASMPQGIENYYAQQLTRLYGSSPVTKSASQKIFDAILQFPPSVSAITIQRYTSLDFDTIHDVCKAASSIKLIEEYENDFHVRFYSYFHKSFYDYLAAELHSEERPKRFLNLFHALKEDFEYGQDEFSLLIDASPNDLINVLFSLCDGLNKLGILGSKRYEDFNDLVEIFINTAFLQIALATHAGTQIKDRLEIIQNAFNKQRGEETINPLLGAIKFSMAQNSFINLTSNKIRNFLRSLDEDKD